MTAKVKLTKAQRVGLERCREEKVHYYKPRSGRPDRYATFSWAHPAVDRNVIERLAKLGLVEVVFRDAEKEGFVIPTEAGLIALESA
jgi:ribosomal protein S19E (S16A)